MANIILRRFYQVTRSSLYIASFDETDGVCLKKLAGRDNAKIVVGHCFTGELLAITDRHGVFPYFQDFSHYSSARKNPQLPEEVNTLNWGGGTSPTVALFTNQKRAFSCYRAKNLATPDPRWRPETEKTLAAIGRGHPRFIPARMPGLRIRFPEAQPPTDV